MDIHYDKKFKEACSLFKKGHFFDATAKFADLTNLTINNIQEDFNPLEPMKWTIDAYNHWCLEQKIDFFMSLEDTSELIEQYYATIRHFLDHREEKNIKKIEQEINGKIPIGTADDRNFFSECGPSSLEQAKIGPYQVVVVSSQGPRKKMEDSHLFKEIKVKLKGKRELSKIQIFAIFDGHGGQACASFVKQYLPEALILAFQEIESFDDYNLYNAISKAFVLLDDSWQNLPFQKTHLRDYSGTTATAAIIIDKKNLWVANVGDSRSVLGIGNSAIQLSKDAKPTIKKYQDEIHLRGGYVMWGRVDGNLDMARSIGDIAHPSITARPTLKKFDLSTIPKNENCNLILACDGLWNVIDPTLAIETMAKKTLHQATNDLKDLAYQMGSLDNVTAMVIKLS